MASLRKLRGKYYARLRVNGREKLLPLKTSHKPDAERRLRLINEKEWLVIARLEVELTLEDLPSISESIDLFIQDSKNKQLSTRTIESYSNALRRFKQAINATKRVDRITKHDIEIMLNYLNEQYAPTSVNSLVKSINTYLNWLRNKYNIDLPPKIKEIRVEKKLPEFLTPDELDKIYSLCEDPKMRATFRIYECTGIRLRELHNCQLDDSANGKYIKLTKTKGKKERIIPIPPDIVDDFKLAFNGSHFHVKATTGPYSPYYISHSFSKLRKQAGVSSNKSIHSLRHTFALRKLLELGNIYLVMQMLGHADVKTTQVYLDFPNGYIKEIFSTWLPEIQGKMKSADMRINT